jgi:protein Tex
MEFSIALDTELLAKQLKLSDEQIRQAMDLMDSGFSIPFLAVYRREQIGGLGEEDLRALRDAVYAMRQLNERKTTVLRSIHGQGKLTEALEKNIRSAKSVRELEDLYLPFKKTKRSKGSHHRRELMASAEEAILGAVEPIDLQALVGPVYAEAGFSSDAEAITELHQMLQEHFVYLPQVRGRAREFIRSRAVLLTRHAPIDGGGEESADEERHDSVSPADPSTDAAHPTEVSDTPTSGPGDDNLNLHDELAEGSEFEESDGSAEKDTSSEEVKVDTHADLAGMGENASGSSDEAAPQEQALETSAASSSAADTSKADDQQNRLKAIVSIARQRRLQRREARKKRRSRLEGSFKPFLQFRRHVHKITPPEWLAIDYGERVRVLDVKVEMDCEHLTNECWSVLGLQNHPHASMLRECLAKGLAEEQGALVREVQRDAVESAEHQRLASQRRRLMQWIRQKPLEAPVLAIEPRLRREGTVVVLDANGSLVSHESLMFGGSEEVQAVAANRIAALLREHSVRIVAVGDGPGSRDVDQVLRKLARDPDNPPEFQIAEVSSAATNLYAKGGRASREFPNHPDQVRRTIALGRRLQDPMRELLRIDAVRLGRAVFGEENKSNQFNMLLHDTYRSCLAEVHLDANDSDSALFRYLPGMNPAYAQILEQQRRETGGFTSRDMIMSTPGIDESALTQAIGFLQVKQSENLFDRTSVHPERYAAAETLLNHAGIGIEGLRTVLESESLETRDKIAEVLTHWRSALGKIDVVSTAQATGLEVGVIRDLLYHFRNVGKKVRDTFLEPMLRSPKVDLRQLQVDDELVGVVVNLVDYGAFVELGPGTVGLLHVSRMSDGFVKSAREVVQEDDVVRVWVTEVDPQKGRISLSLFRPQAAPTAPQQERRFDRRSREDHRSDQGSRRPQGRQDYARTPTPERKKNRPPTPVVPITDAMKDGKEPMRTFSDLMQFYQTAREEAPAGAKKGSSAATPPAQPSPDTPSDA